MHYDPKERVLMEKVALELLEEMQQVCANMGSRLVVMYIPPLYDVQPQFQEPLINLALASAKLVHEDLKHTDQLADTVRKHAEGLGISFVDLREPYRAASEFLYWGSDHHINIRGNEVAAEALGATLRDLVF